MRGSKATLDYLKEKSLYELTRRFDIIKSIGIGLVVAIILGLFELFRLGVEGIFAHNAKLGHYSVSILSRLFILLFLGILTILLFIKSYSPKLLLLSLKEKGIDKIKNRKKAIRRIEEEFEEAENI